MADLLINGVTYAGVSSVSIRKTDGTDQEFILKGSEMVNMSSITRLGAANADSISAGLYWCDYTIVTGLPVSQWGLLEVIGDGEPQLQRYTAYPDSAVYTRLFANAAWSAWHTV